ncbi:hypothetical protein [Paenibacillus kobensis]|uniref:hypothetical protein n=1 Tax=Paenibacillus kobensis TaxID=59841 RepID=UPI000FDAFAE1|nr:hypothetical protein [Paenibacillus kobensis]
MFTISMRRSFLTLLVAVPLVLSGCSVHSSRSLSQSGSSVQMDTSSSSEASASVAHQGEAVQPSLSPVSTAANSVSSHVGIHQVSALRLADANTGWIAGDGQIARTDDGGAHWKTQYSGSAAVLQLFALNSKLVWATLDNGTGKSARLIRSTDGGSHWQTVGTVPNRSFLHFTNNKTAYSGSAVTTDGGATWSKLPTPPSLIGDVYYHDAANGWAVQSGKGKFMFLHTADEGKHWSTVMTRAAEAMPLDSLIRSTGKNDAWIELIGGSGMTQTSYSLFHTSDGGKSWLPAIVKNGAGSGPAPGFTMNDTGKYPSGTGSSPGALYVVNPQTAFMGGQCMACDHPNTLTETTNGGKSWSVRKGEFDGYGPQFLSASDASHVWLVTTENEKPSVLYTSADGGRSWHTTYTFNKPKPVTK